MKKLIPAFAMIALIVGIAMASSCKKTSTPPALQYWSIDSTNYQPDTIARLNNMLYAKDSIGLIVFKFGAFPVTSGVYKIGNPDSNANEVYIEARTGTDYFSRSGSITVTVNSGKLTVDASQILMLKIPMINDTARLSAHLIEQ